MISIKKFKDQLFEFIEFNSESFDAVFIYRQCIQPISRPMFRVLYQLECEGKILRLRDGRYISIRIAIKRWLKGKALEIKVPKEVTDEVNQVIMLMPEYYETINSFISEAIREYINKIRREWTESFFCERNKRGNDLGNK